MDDFSWTANLLVKSENMDKTAKKVERATENILTVNEILFDEGMTVTEKNKAVENVYKLQPSFYFGIVIGATLLTLGVLMIVKPNFLKGFLTNPNK